MAQQKLVPLSFAQCNVPQCATCLYGRATKHTRKTRAPLNKISPRVITGPVDCISVDLLESSTPSLITQILGWIAREWYHAATTFVDHYSWLSYVYLQWSTKGDKMVQARRAFKVCAHSHGISIRHYHCDNRLLWEGIHGTHQAKRPNHFLLWCQHTFENALTKKRIRDCQDAARTMLVHAKHWWPAAINSHLWP